MSFEEMVVAVVGATGAFILVGYLSSKIFGLIQSWINRKGGSITEEEFSRLGKAFMKHKKKTENRLQNLEAIISDEEESSSKQIEAPKKTIEIEDEETEKEKKNQSDNPNNLRNMLRE